MLASRTPILLAAGLALAMLPGQASADQSVTITETEYKLTPSDFDATAGQVVHFTVTNHGTTEHNLTVELPSANLEKELFDTNLKPGETKTVDYTFPQAGSWEIYCPVDGHEDLGMKGDVDVKAAAAAPASTSAGAGPARPAEVAPASPTYPPAAATAPAAPAAAAAAPARAPAQLPNTGRAPFGLVGVALAGLGLLGGGLLARRRRAR